VGNGVKFWVIKIDTIIITFTGFGREEGLQYVKGKPQNIYTKRIHSSFPCYEIFLIFCNDCLDYPAVPVM
jgi:hypothetical protein